MNIEQRISAVAEKAAAVATLCDVDLARPVVYCSRGRIMLDAIAGVLAAMNQIECVGTQSDFNDDWRALRSRLAHSQGRFEAIISGSGDQQIIPCHSRQRDSRNWHL